jgi:hypothetical protein
MFFWILSVLGAVFACTNLIATKGATVEGINTFLLLKISILT